MKLRPLMRGPRMSKYTRRFGAPFALVAALSFSACTVSDSKSDTSLARDTALNRDLELANRDSAVQPQLNDVPATPAADADDYSEARRLAAGSASGASGCHHAAGADHKDDGLRQHRDA